MRDIKFRVWNGMEMVYDITTGNFGTFYVNPEKGDGLNPEDMASLTVNTTRYHEETPLMQYTGLKDKNGKEIYEGDIFKKGLDTYLVVCKNTCSGFSWHKIYDSWLNRSVYDDNRISWLSKVDCYMYEIIGNIHENKELLK